MAGSDWSTPVANNSRIADDALNWQGACDADIGGWTKANEIIVALFAYCDVHAGCSDSFTIQWQNVTDAGAWTTLAAGAGELRQGNSVAITNGDPVGTSSGCQATEDSEEVVGDNTTDALVTTGKDEVEVQVSIDMSNAIDGKQYQFRLYDNGANVGLGAVSAAITIESLAKAIAPDNLESVALVNDSVLIRWIMPDDMESVALVNDAALIRWIMPDDMVSEAAVADVGISKSIAPGDIVSTAQVDDSVLGRIIFAEDVISTADVADATVVSDRDHFIDTADDDWQDTSDDEWYQIIPDAPSGEDIPADDLVSDSSVVDVSIARIQFWDIAADDLVSDSLVVDAPLVPERFIGPEDVISTALVDDSVLGRVISVEDVISDSLVPDVTVQKVGNWDIAADNLISDSSVVDEPLVKVAYIDGADIVSTAQIDDAALIRLIFPEDIVSTAQVDDAVLGRVIFAEDVISTALVADVGIAKSIAAGDVISDSLVADVTVEEAGLAEEIAAGDLLSDSLVADAVLGRVISPEDILSDSSISDVPFFVAITDAFMDSDDDEWQDTVDDQWFPYREIAAENVISTAEVEGDIAKVAKIVFGNLIADASVVDAPVEIGGYKDLYPDDVVSDSLVEDVGVSGAFAIQPIDIAVPTEVGDSHIGKGVFIFVDDDDFTFVDDSDFVWEPALARETPTPDDVVSTALVGDVSIQRKKDIAVGDMIVECLFPDVRVYTSLDMAPADVVSTALVEDAIIPHPIHADDVISDSDISGLLNKVAFIDAEDVLSASLVSDLEGWWLTKRRARRMGMLLGVY